MRDSTCIVGPVERHKPRAVTQAGLWQIDRTQFKVYGLLADGKALTPDIMHDAEAFVRDELPGIIEREGADNGAGFVVIHPGDLGISTVAHWWVQGSVLCQRIRRKLYGAEEPMNPATRSVIACVWELAVINAEQQIWRDTMMGEQPNIQAYLRTRVSAGFV